MGEPTSTDNAISNGCHEKSLLDNPILDRQIRLWGVEAQKRLLNAHVLYVGMSSINVEAAKNLTLAGVKATLCDDRPLTTYDRSFNFLPALDELPDDQKTVSVGQSKVYNCADASIRGLRSIASITESDTLSESAFKRALSSGGDQLKKFISRFTCICLSGEAYPLHTLVILDNCCRELGIGLSVSHCCGGYGFVYLDFHSYSYMPLGDKLNSQQEKFEHPSLQSMLEADLALLDCKVDSSIKVFLGLYRWENARNRQYQLLNNSATLSLVTKTDMADYIRLLFSENSPALHEKLEEIIGDVANTYNQQGGATAAVTGGLLAQELRKFITKEQEPIPNCLVFHMDGSEASVCMVPATQ